MRKGWLEKEVGVKGLIWRVEGWTVEQRGRKKKRCLRDKQKERYGNAIRGKSRYCGVQQVFHPTTGALAKQSEHFFERLESFKQFKHRVRTAKKSDFICARSQTETKLGYVGLQRISGDQPVLEYLSGWGRPPRSLRGQSATLQFVEKQ